MCTGMFQTAVDIHAFLRHYLLCDVYTYLLSAHITEAELSLWLVRRFLRQFLPNQMLSSAQKLTGYLKA